MPRGHQAAATFPARSMGDVVAGLKEVSAAVAQSQRAAAEAPAQQQAAAAADPEGAWRQTGDGAKWLECLDDADVAGGAGGVTAGAGGCCDVAWLTRRSWAAAALSSVQVCLVAVQRPHSHQNQPSHACLLHSPRLAQWQSGASPMPCRCCAVWRSCCSALWRPLMPPTRPSRCGGRAVCAQPGVWHGGHGWAGTRFSLQPVLGLAVLQPVQRLGASLGLSPPCRPWPAPQARLDALGGEVEARRERLMRIAEQQVLQVGRAAGWPVVRGWAKPPCHLPALLRCSGSLTAPYSSAALLLVPAC